DLAIAAQFQYGFVTGAFALFNEARSQPPDQRVKPEDGFHQHVKCSRQIVAAAYVPEFVREDGVEVRVFEASGDSLWPYQNRPRYAENPRFQGSRRQVHFDRVAYPARSLQPAKYLQFAPLTQWLCFPQGCEN